MFRTVTALAVALLLLLSSGVPASAQTWFQFRYWNSKNITLDFGNTFDSGLFGLSIRRNVLGGDWALSFNWDSGSVRNFAGGPTIVGDYNRFWNLNLHRNFGTPSGMFSVYAGYGGAALEFPSFPAYIRQTGWRIGADAMVNFRNNWYVVGDLGYTPSQSTFSQLNWNLGGVVNTSASIVDWKLGLGYKLTEMFSGEIGYRKINWNYNSAVMCGFTPCGVEWKGFYFGVNVTTP